MSKYFDAGIKLTGVVTRSNADMEKAFIYAFPDDDGKGVTVRHKPWIPPQFLIELGEKLIEIGKRLQQ